MAIAAPPNNVIVQQGNRQVLVSWDLSPGATLYSIQRSTDQINYSLVGTSSSTNFIDTTVTVGVEYWYTVFSANPYGNSAQTLPVSIIPAPTAEMSLGQLRLMAQQKADRVNSDFVTTSEWNNYINLAMFELYDLLIESDPDLFTATPYQFTTNGSQFLYPLPDGQISYVNGITQQAGYVAPPFFKLMGIDLSVNSSSNAWVTINKFNFIDRNKFIYPNTSSTIYGVFNLRYRLVGMNIEFIPVPTSNQQIRVWYVPRLRQLLADTDLTTIGFSGWIQYAIVRAAKYALDKEESDTSKLDAELMFLRQRIEETASVRDQGRPDTMSDVQTWGNWGMNGPFDGFRGGF